MSRTVTVGAWPLPCSGVEGGQVAEDHRRAERASRAAVCHAERRAHDVAGGVEAGDRIAVDVDGATVWVDLRSALRAEAATVDLDRVERAGVERTECRFRLALHGRVAPPAGGGAGAAAG